jgi:hypothetical protein
MDMFQGANAGGGAAPEEKDDGKMVDLRDKIDTAMSYAKNEASGFPMSNLFIGDSRLGCKSDTDEQLIIHIEFQEFVKVRIIVDLPLGDHELLEFLGMRSFPFSPSYPILVYRSEASSLRNTTVVKTLKQTLAK